MTSDEKDELQALLANLGAMADREAGAGRYTNSGLAFAAGRAIKAMGDKLSGHDKPESGIPEPSTQTEGVT